MFFKFKLHRYCSSGKWFIYKVSLRGRWSWKQVKQCRYHLVIRLKSSKSCYYAATLSQGSQVSRTVTYFSHFSRSHATPSISQAFQPFLMLGNKGELVPLYSLQLIDEGQISAELIAASSYTELKTSPSETSPPVCMCWKVAIDRPDQTRNA